ncbi:hypothetical protein KIN20_026862 [Parelaphostrongylus tenuis]|uniref:Uncharacterized protein n=1 Tax=Parelaphostrongylus tenuis TaxID=148309 RepID=A0AAD5QYJ5_PARTN|nr:hypothetical protein KIN20_026862 [Parelaphostrongylus tenuis]
MAITVLVAAGERHRSCYGNRSDDVIALLRNRTVSGAFLRDSVTISKIKIQVQVRIQVGSGWESAGGESGAYAGRGG